MVTTTVYVQYNPTTAVVTLSGGTEPANDGTVMADAGTNTIQFVGKDQDTNVWTMDTVTWANTTALPDPSTFRIVLQSATQIDLVDDDLVTGRAAVPWEYTVFVNDRAKRLKRKADPQIINRPPPNAVRRMSGYN